MGVASIDVSRALQQIVVAVYPPPMSLVEGSSLVAPYEGRLLLFPLPITSDTQSFFGYYIDYASTTFDYVRDRARDAYSETVENARDRLQDEMKKASKKFSAAGKKLITSIGSWWTKDNK